MMFVPQPITRRRFLVNGVVVGGGLAAARALPALISASDRVRFGLIGLGERGRRLLADCRLDPRVQIAAACDINLNAWTACRRMLGADASSVAFVHDFRRILDASDIDAVSIALPLALRSVVIRAACAAGKHVLIETPWSASNDEDDAILKFARMSGRLVHAVRRDGGPEWEDIAAFLPSELHRPAGVSWSVEAPCMPLVTADLTDSAMHIPLDLGRRLLRASAPSRVLCVTSGPNELATRSAHVHVEFADIGGTRALGVHITRSPSGIPPFSRAILHLNGRRMSADIEIRPLIEDTPEHPGAAAGRFIEALLRDRAAWLELTRDAHAMHSLDRATVKAFDDPGSQVFATEAGNFAE